MARSYGDIRGAYSELECGRIIVTPAHCTDYQAAHSSALDKSSITIPTVRIPHDQHRTEVHTSQSTGENDVEEIIVQPDSTKRKKYNTVQNLRICIGNWLCLLVGLIVLSGSITMTVFGFLANDFSQTINNVGNVTSKERDDALYETLTKLKTYGPIMIGCGCFIIMCACVLLCDARDRLKAAIEPEDTKKDTAAINYVEAFRRMYEEEMRQKDAEETERRTKKIDEYFEYMSRYPIGRRTLIRALRPRSFSDPCVRLDTPLPDSYEYAKERLRNNPIGRNSKANGTYSDLDVNLSMNQHFIRSTKPKSASQNSIQHLSPSHQITLESKPTNLATLPPIKSRSNNGPIKVNVDTSSLPVGSLEKLYLGDDTIIGGTRKKQKRKKGKRKKKTANPKADAEGENSHPVSTLPDTNQETTDVKTASKLEVAQEARNPILLDPAKDQLELSQSDRIDGFRFTDVKSGYHGHENTDSPLAAARASRDKIITVASVTSELEPSARTMKWVTESNDQPWNRTWSDNRYTTEPFGDDELNETADSNSNIRKSSTGSLSFEGPSTLGLGHQAMVL